MQSEDINKVFELNKGKLMNIHGVVGVYISALGDGTPCIKVMVEDNTPEITEKIPHELGGYPVIVVPTGDVVPYGQEQSK